MLGAAAAHAQPAANGVLLVARPEMPDPRFRETVVLATQTAEANTVGVILNRPLRAGLGDYLPQAHDPARPIFYGGPVMERVVVALFRSAGPPEGAAFPVLRGIYLSMHPALIAPLAAAPAAPARFFAGFSGWAPRQLEAELRTESWYVLPASADLLFRTDFERLWPELVERARRFRTRTAAESGAILVP